MTSHQARRPATQPSTPLGTGGRAIPLPLAAGATTNLTVTGTNFYFIVATAAVNVRPGGNYGGGGDFSTYSQGTGDHTQVPFEWIEINNPNSIPIVLLVWVGFDDFIDNRLILANSSLPNIAYPTQPTATTAQILIPDLSGGAFYDINGNKWLAIFRQTILISNLDPATPVLLQKYGAATSSGPAVLNCPPQLPVQFDGSGNYTIVGGSANVIVSELYQAIPAS